MAFAIGVDLGGTSIKSALISEKGKIIKRIEILTEAEKGQDHVLNNLKSAIKKVMIKKPKGIGIGSPGPMDYKKGIIINPINLPFKRISLRNLIQKKFSKPTYLDNDANCFTLAEAMFGQGKKSNNVVGITLGTGFGGGLVIDKRIYHGRNNAAELGHMTIDYDGIKSLSGNDGAIEDMVAARGLTRVYDGVTNPKKIFESALKGDKKARHIYRRMGFHIGIALANITYAFDPDMIIIGGKISGSWSLFHKPMYAELKKRYFTRPPKIIKSKLNDAGILGAAALVFENK
jgi:glucokinase